MAKDSDEAADRPWNGDKAGWIEAEKLFDRKIYDQLGDPGQWYWREKFPLETSAWNVNDMCEQILLSLREQRNAKYADRGVKRTTYVCNTYCAANGRDPRAMRLLVSED